MRHLRKRGDEVRKVMTIPDDRNGRLNDSRTRSNVVAAVCAVSPYNSDSVILAFAADSPRGC